MSAQTSEDQQARVIARAVLQHSAKRTGDIDTMRAAALTLNATRQPDTAKENPR